LAYTPPETTPLRFSDLSGWSEDDHRAAFAAFWRSLGKLRSIGGSVGEERLTLLREAARVVGADPTAKAARMFFETHFSPHLVRKTAGEGMVTGYYEPELAGSLTPDETFHLPVYGQPDDLVLVTDENKPASFPGELTAARARETGLIPYFTRREIEQGALQGRGLELVYLSDAPDAFVMHVQGSGLIRLPGGKALRIGFSGKNGHPYTSIGKRLVEMGELDLANASLDAVLGWIRADAERGRRVMWENKSYIFFRLLNEAEADEGPHGALGVPLTPGRSLAVDPRFHLLGLPVWVSAPALNDVQGHPFNRLMIAQDTGSAIRGPSRGDIFWGSGEPAGRVAGKTRHSCEFCILIPN
jgi:membrane-bound lytic murein transglycosylase A